MGLSLVSRNTLVAIKPSIAKNALNWLRKAVVRLGKLRLGKGRATEQSAELSLCSKPNSPLNWYSYSTISVSNNKSRTRSLRIMS
jgi:hypothetical protein